MNAQYARQIGGSHVILVHEVLQRINASEGGGVDVVLRCFIGLHKLNQRFKI